MCRIAAIAIDCKSIGLTAYEGSSPSMPTNLEKSKHKTMNVGHKLGRLRNRLARLKKKTPDAGADRQGMMTARIAEIEEILRKVKV